MVHLVQLEVTNFYCSAAQFQSFEFHYNRLWSHYLFLLKIKAFKLMFHFARHQSTLNEPNLPQEWFTFGESLPISHVLNRDTFISIMTDRNLSIEDLQKVGYTRMSSHEIELFDQSTIEEYLKATFTLNEFVFAASQVKVVLPPAVMP